MTTENIGTLQLVAHSSRGTARKLLERDVCDDLPSREMTPGESDGKGKPLQMIATATSTIAGGCRAVKWLT
jgi:hypothetical protein